MNLPTLPLVLAAALAAPAIRAESPLEADFRNPPVKARPYVWWHWLGPNFSKEGITKDLEAMKASGIGGATIFNITSSVMESHAPTLNNPWPDQTYRSPKYWDAMKHAAAEAQRLGLELGLHNTVGYSTTGGPWIDEPRSMQRIVSSSTTVNGGSKVRVQLPPPPFQADEGWGKTGRKISWFKDFAVLALPDDGKPVPADRVVDLTKRTDTSGTLEWDAPPGRWKVLRLAHASNGRPPHPVPDDLLGKVLEVDKMSREQNAWHWDQVIGPMKQHLGSHLGRSMKHFLIDSFEAGPQNWTPGFRDEFRKRKGYDPLPWLPAISGTVIGDADLTARFKWDFDDVIRNLFHENGWLTGLAKMREVGMELQFEPYGGQFDTVDGTAISDIPMGEFWTGGGGSISSTIIAAAAAAGKKVVGAEAFTGPPTLSKWSETPAFLKRSADGSYACGVNRLILHHWVHQPFDDRYKPGMGMGWWGTHFNRHQTWAKDGTAFFQYLGRCQALLQQGERPADFVSIAKEQGGDVISWRMFREGVTVRDGRIVLPSGRSYAFISIPHNGLIAPDDVKRILSLVEQGAIVVCTPPKGAPGLSGHPETSRTVARLAESWSAAGKPGKGRMLASGDVGAALRELKIAPLVEIRGSSTVRTAARRTGDAMIFFTANTGAESTRFTSSFRIAGMRPELWNAEDGSIRFAPVWRAANGRTEVDLELGGHKSVFVVFRSKELPADHVVKLGTSGSAGALEILKARFGAPGPDKWRDVTAQLRELAAGGSIHIPSVHPGVFRNDPAPNVVKVLEVEYRLGGKQAHITVGEKQPLSLGERSKPDALSLRTSAAGSVAVASTSATQAELTFASGKRSMMEIPAPPAPVEVTGPWSVSLDSPVADTRAITLTALSDLSLHQDPEVKYFSGTATYAATFEAPPGKHPLQLDLGRVHDLARVSINGRDLGVLWHPPFRIDVTDAVKPGTNRIEIAVTNTWHNRLVGDEQHPPDFEWGGDRAEKGRALKGYPDWFLKNQPRPQQGRKCFVVWYYHRKDTPLLPSGLLGPVRLVPLSESKLDP